MRRFARAQVVLVIALLASTVVPPAGRVVDASVLIGQLGSPTVRQLPSAEQIPAVLDEAVGRGRLPQALRDATLPSGTARVIVELHLPAPFVAEGELPSPSAVRHQRAAIAGSQSSVRTGLQAVYTAEVKEFQTIPFLALETDAAGLAILARSNGVVRIGPDEAVEVMMPAPGQPAPSIERDTTSEPALAESEPLIGALALWSAGITGAGRAVAILDTGVDRNHVFLAGKVVSEACYSTSSAANSTTSVCPGGVDTVEPGSGGPCLLTVSGCDHGTHVAGIAAGAATTFSGVARGSNIIALQVFSRKESTFASPCSNGAAACAVSFNSDQVLGLERVLALRTSFAIASANMSLGGGRFSNQATCDASVSNQATKAAIDNLRSVNVATVIASGNDGFADSTSSPGCISSAVTVGSTTKGDAVSSFSNSASFVDLLAPGSLIASSVPNNQFAFKSGTSMATPHVAGAFALLKSKSPNATIAQIEDALKASGRSIRDPRNGITKSRIQVDAAANLLPGSSGLANDNFAPPIPVPGLGTVLTANTTTATTELSEPLSTAGCGTNGQMGKTVWYSLTVAHLADVRLHTEGSSFDTVAAVYIGNELAGLTRIACDDNGGAGGASRLAFTASPGTTYRIQVGGFAGAGGNLSLTVEGSYGACQSRPPVTMTTAQVNPGQLRVTVRAGLGGISMLRLGRPNRPLVNASVQVVGGPTGLTSSQDIPIAGSPTEVVLILTRTGGVGTPMTVPFAVDDLCGSWDTLAGLGTAAP